MKALFLNGSPHKDGVIALAFDEMTGILEKEGFSCTRIEVGSTPVPGCLACGYCHREKGCFRHDLVDEVNALFEQSDCLIVGSPVYYASPNGTLLSFLDRLFYSGRFDKRMKVGASVVSCRRGGAGTSFDVLNKYFAISQMPIATSQYWNSIHGNSAQEARKDLEGLQTMRVLARNIAFLVKAIKLEKEREGLPEREEGIATNFIR